MFLLPNRKFDNSLFEGSFKTCLPKDVTFVKLNKAPFGFNFIIDEKEFRLAITNTEYYVREDKNER